MTAVRLLVLLAALVLGLSPATAHMPLDGAGHCGQATADAHAGGHHGGADAGGKAAVQHHLPSVCLCALVTTMAPGLPEPATPASASLPPAGAGRTLHGLDPPPADRPPRPSALLA